MQSLNGSYLGLGWTDWAEILWVGPWGARLGFGVIGTGTFSRGRLWKGNGNCCISGVYQRMRLEIYIGGFSGMADTMGIFSYHPFPLEWGRPWTGKGKIALFRMLFHG